MCYKRQLPDGRKLGKKADGTVEVDKVMAEDLKTLWDSTPASQTDLQTLWNETPEAPAIGNPLAAKK